MNNDAEKLDTPETIAALMESSKSEDEWNHNADRVKAANGGYPNFWHATIIQSGLKDRTVAKF